MEEMVPALFPGQLGQSTPTATEQALVSLLNNVTTEVSNLKSATSGSSGTVNRMCGLLSVSWMSFRVSTCTSGS